MPPPRTQLKEGSLLCCPSGMFFWKSVPFRLCGPEPTPSQRWESHFWNWLSNHLIDTHSCQPSLCSFSEMTLGPQLAPQLLSPLPFIWTILMVLMPAWMRRRCEVHVSLWKLPEVSQVSRILTLRGHPVTLCTAFWLKPHCVSLGVWMCRCVAGFCFWYVSPEKQLSSHPGTRCWPCVHKVHCVLTRLVCKRKSHFLKSQSERNHFKSLT